MTMQNNTILYTGAVVLVTALVNVAMAHYGLAQKLSCTLEQSAAVSVAAAGAALTH